jgi:hypothetical protein
MNILYMPVKGIDFVSGYDFRSDFEIIPTVWYFWFFILFLLIRDQSIDTSLYYAYISIPNADHSPEEKSRKEHCRN